MYVTSKCENSIFGASVILEVISAHLPGINVDFIVKLTDENLAYNSYHWAKLI